MTEENLLEIEAEELCLGLKRDLRKGYNELFAFAERSRVSSSILVQIILLGAEISESLSDTGGITLPENVYAELLNKAIEIIKFIIKEKNDSGISVDDLEKVRKVFIEKGRPVSIYECQQISKKLGKFTLQPISFNLKLGEITSVVGENGNGKSTLLKIISGEIAIDEGVHRYPHFSPDVEDWLRIKKQIAYIPQDLKEWSSISTRRDYLHFTAGAKGITGKTNLEAVDYIIARLGLKSYQDYPWDKLSGGYKLRFELARQLVWGPKLLIMDEPLAHLDIKTQRLFLNDLRNLTNSLKSPVSVILSSQNLYEIEKISDNIIFLNQGKATYLGPVANISKSIDTNSILLNINCGIPELTNILSSFGEHIKDITSDGDEVLIKTSLSVKPNAILSALLKADLSVNYFRNISNSSRIFFDHE